MGVCGSGKSLIGARLADALGVAMVEGDEYHPPANVAKMAAGIPLADADRAGWLDALAERLAEARREGRGLLVTCSALKRPYRDRLREGDPEARFIHLSADRELLAARMTSRSGHFMPASLLDSQLATLEPPAPDEHAWVVDAARPAEDIVRELLARIEDRA